MNSFIHSFIHSVIAPLHCITASTLITLGTDWDEIKSITKQVTLALKHVHEYGFIHGDIKPSNIIAVGQKIKLIDLDASASFNRGEYAGAKYSSGYVPPELLYLDQDGHPKVRTVKGTYA